MRIWCVGVAAVGVLMVASPAAAQISDDLRRVKKLKPPQKRGVVRSRYIRAAWPTATRWSSTRSISRRRRSCG